MSKTYDMEIGSFIRFGMENAKKHWMKFFAVNLGSILAVGLLTLLASGIHSYLALLVFALSSMAVSFGVFSNVIRLASNRSFDLKAFLPEPRIILNYILGMLLLAVLLTIGFILLILPGLIMSVLFCLVPFLIVDKQMNFLAAFKESFRLTKSHLADISFGLIISNVMVQILSIFVVTLFFTIPMGAFISVYPYAQLVGIADKPEDEATGESVPTGDTMPA